MWVFKQKTGELLAPDQERAAIGYAGGNCGQNPEGKNNPDMQAVPRVGPLPRGIYTMSEPVPQSHLGPYAIPLKPSKVNDMFSRSGFYVHGDRTASPGSASEGCIIMPRAVRQQMWESGDHTVVVL